MAFHRGYTYHGRILSFAAILCVVQVSCVHSFTSPLPPPKRATRGYRRQATEALHASNNAGGDEINLISYPAIENELKRIRQNFEDEIKELEGEIVAKEKETLGIAQQKEKEALEAVRSGIESKEKEVFDLVQLKEREALDAMKGYFQEKDR